MQEKLAMISLEGGIRNEVARRRSRNEEPKR
jgi:hypothetical protein